MKYEQLFRLQQRLANYTDILGGEYCTTFIRAVDAAVEREFIAAENKRKADNLAKLAEMRRKAGA